MSEQGSKKSSATNGINKLLIVLFTILLTSLTTILFWLIAFHMLGSPGFLKYLGLVENYVLANPDLNLEPYATYMVGELVKNGTIVSVNDVWEFQSTFYQTVVTLLIALNALIGVFVFAVIKGGSEDAAKVVAEKTAFKEVKIAVSNQEFYEKVDENISKKIEPYKNDLKEKFIATDFLEEEVEALKEQVEIQADHIKKISMMVSLLDKEEQTGSGFTITTSSEDM